MEGIEEKSKPDFLRWALVALVVLIGLGVVGGGIFVYQKTLNKKETLVAVTPTPFPLTEEPVSTPQPTITPKAEVKRVDLKIKVLNGMGVPGAAAKAASFLEKLGYEGIKTGNADNYDYQKTVIKIKESKKDYLEQLKTDLSKNYSLDEPQTLDEEENFDVIIVLGKE